MKPLLLHTRWARLKKSEADEAPLFIIHEITAILSDSGAMFFLARKSVL